MQNIIQVVDATYSTYSSVSASSIPLDDTIPQNTEGTEILTVSITPTNATNILLIELDVPFLWPSTASTATLALFQDSTADALTAGVVTSATGYPNSGRLSHRMTAGTISSTTFKFRMGVNTGTTYINGNTTTRYFGGVQAVRFRVTEVKP